MDNDDWMNDSDNSSSCCHDVTTTTTDTTDSFVGDHSTVSISMDSSPDVGDNANHNNNHFHNGNLSQQPHKLVQSNSCVKKGQYPEVIVKEQEADMKDSGATSTRIAQDNTSSFPVEMRSYIS